jgi:hypothetical protein
MLCHRIGNFVSFEDMLEGADSDMEVIAQFDKCKDFVLAVAMAMDPAFTTEDLGDRFELKISARW